MSRYVIAVIIALLSLMSCVLEGTSVDHSIGKASRRTHPSPTPNQDTGPRISKACEPDIWTGEISGKRLTWTVQDIWVEKNGRRTGIFLPSFAKLHSRNVNEVRDSLRSDSELTKQRRAMKLNTMADVQISSVVGPYVTFEIEYGSGLDGSAASHWVWWLTVDISKDGAIDPFTLDGIENTRVPTTPRLHDIFPKTAITKALFEDPVIRRELERTGRGNDPAALEFLFDGNYNEGLRIGDDGGSLTSYSLEHFVFQSVENDTVNVRLALAEFAVTKTYKVSFLELKLPIPDKYTSAFRSAKDGDRGFLASDREKASKGCRTSLQMTSEIVELL